MILCDACGTELHRRDEVFLAMINVNNGQGPVAICALCFSDVSQRVWTWRSLAAGQCAQGRVNMANVDDVLSGKYGELKRDEFVKKWQGDQHDFGDKIARRPRGLNKILVPPVVTE